MKRIAVLQSNYIPWKGYFDIIAAADEFLIYDNIQYTKNDWRNRNQIKTAQGKSWLTVPVCHEHSGQKIQETRISDARCFRKHWNGFRQSYAKAPHLDYCRDVFEDFFLAPTPPTMLSDVNRQLIERACGALGIRTHISDAADYAPQGDRMERLLDLCRKTGATHYLSGPAAQNYIDAAVFRDAGIELEWMRYDGYREYPQPHPPFDHAVSVLDLIASTGEDAATYLLRTGSRA